MTERLELETGEVLNLSDFPLPDGFEDETFNRDELAKAMDVSTVTITRWVDSGMPVAKRGGNGQSYEFQFSHCYAWRMWREDREASDRRAKNDRAAQLSMLFRGVEEEDDDPSHGLSPKAVREWSEAELIRNKAAQQRGELVRAAHVQDVLDTILVSFRNSLSSFPDWLEQEFSLSPHQVDKAQRFCDSMLAETRRQISEAGFQSRAVTDMVGDKHHG